MDGEAELAFDARLGGQVGQLDEGGQVFRAAVGIAAVVDGVDAEEDVGRADGLGKGQRQAKSTVLRAGT